MKTPQIKPTWQTGVYVGNGTVVPETETPTIVDDGTLDTVVTYRDRTYRYDTLFRLEFKHDDAFLAWVKDYVDDDDNIPMLEV